MKLKTTVTYDRTIGMVNGLLRALSILSRFVLLLLLLKRSTPEVLGAYGVLSATIAFLSLIVGADFYQYAQREVIAQPAERRSFVLQQQAIVTLGLYAIILPLSSLIFALNVLPIQLLVSFYALTIVEHLGQELGRTLTSLERPLLAGLVLFLRTASWIWLLLITADDVITLNHVIYMWLTGSVAGLLLAATAVFQACRPWKTWPMDTPWIAQGLRNAMLYFGATLALKGMTTVDRYMVQQISNSEVVGAYVAYIGIGMTLINLLDATVFAPIFPKLIRLHAAGDQSAYEKQYKVLRNQTWALSILASLMSCFIAPFVFRWADKPIYLTHMSIYYVVVIGVFFYAVSMVPHYALYARRKDMAIVGTQIGALLPFALTFALTSSLFPAESAALSLAVAFAFMFTLKAVLNRSHR